MFCSFCGKQLEEDASYCSQCGKTVRREDVGIRTKRREEYVGNIRKCPACGEMISSFLVNCPSCGYELANVQVTKSVQNFVDKLERIENEVANSNCENMHGWKEWGIGLKSIWVIINVFLLGIPLVAYMLKLIFQSNILSQLSTEEKKKAELIENYIFPNDRESMLEGMLFIKGKVRFLSSGKRDKKNKFWLHLWIDKGRQLYKKTEIMMGEDKVAKEAFDTITKIDVKRKQQDRINLFLRLSCLAVYIVFVVYVVLSTAIAFTRFARNVYNIGENREREQIISWPRNGLALYIPEPETLNGEILLNDDETFFIEIESISEKQYENYINSCQQKGYTKDSEKTSSSYTAFNEEGYKLNLLYFATLSSLQIQVDAPLAMGKLNWPKSKIAEYVPVPKSNIGEIAWEAEYGFVIYVGNTSKDDYREYVDACYEMGFDVDYKRGEDYFYADNSEGYHVSVNYEGNNTMFLRIDDPE